jgi:hypothetical protein
MDGNGWHTACKDIGRSGGMPVGTEDSIAKALRWKTRST